MFLRKIVLTVIGMAIGGVAIGFPLQALAAEKADPAHGVRVIIEGRFPAPPPPGRDSAQDAARDVDAMVQEFYARRDYQPAWKAPQAQALIKAISEADQEGLDPHGYDLHEIRRLMTAAGLTGETEGAVADENLAQLDILLTQTFLHYALHLSQGRLDPEEWYLQWVPYRRPVDLLQALQEGHATGDMDKALKSLASRHPSYLQMRRELAALRQLASVGGWPMLGGSAKLKKGDRGRDVALLKKRLVLSGDLNAGDMGDDMRFDTPMEAAVRMFQWRHGLVASGVVDGETRGALNVPVEQRIRQLEINMERWRWLPDDFGPRYVMTIIPDLWLYVVDEQKTVLSMKTVIGTAKQPSPIFSDEMSYLEINPRWGLPNSIVAKEIIPKVKQDPDYLTKKQIRIYQNWSENAREIDPKTIDWARMNPEKFPYRMVQDSGVNPLGRIKFMFPNEFDVYLHDTTERYLFRRHRRLFSHGCIRLEKPFDLGEWVLRDDPSWSRERILAEIKKRKRLQVNLLRTVPVHVMYLTAWVDGNGLLQFRQDYYGYDKIHEEALRMLNRSRTGRQQSRKAGTFLGMNVTVH